MNFRRNKQENLESKVFKIRTSRTNRSTVKIDKSSAHCPASVVAVITIIKVMHTTAKSTTLYHLKLKKYLVGNIFLEFTEPKRMRVVNITSYGICLHCERHLKENVWKLFFSLGSHNLCSPGETQGVLLNE